MAQPASKEGVLETGTLNAYPFYAPRFWHGMRIVPYARLLMRNRFRIHPLRMPMAVGIGFCAPVNSTLAALQSAIYGRRLREVRVDPPPVFIIGHWRSGTTHLHELLSLDQRFTCPTTYECFAPDHFLVTGGVLPRLLGFLLPKKRPMDDMAVGFDRPQEDEFALCAMGAPTPMLRTAFPNDPPPHLGLLDMQDVTEDELLAWRTALERFIRSIVFARPGQRLILKSPPHTGRIKHLAEMFPGAQFIHLSRHPLKLFPSTMRLWKTLDEAQAFQICRHTHLEEFAFHACERMYRGYEQQRPHLPQESICELRYEDLIRDPQAQVRRIYEHLQLGDYNDVAPRLDDYLLTQREYRASTYRLEPQLEEKIRQRWQFYFQRFGYE